jgi:hypothetical protein
MRKVGSLLAAVAAMCGVSVMQGPASAASANVFNMGLVDPSLTSLSFVNVGDAGNAPNVYKGYDGNPLRAIAYAYQMGKYDVTAAQYC